MNQKEESEPGPSSSTKKKSIVGENNKTKQVKKSSKRPREVSSKHPVSAFRRVVEIEKSKNFDPRFSSNCGEFDDYQFRQNYGFLDDLRKKEIRVLKKAYKKTVKKGVKQRAERIQKNYIRLQNQQKSAKEARLKHLVNAELRQENIERMNRGEKPIYCNNRVKSLLLLSKK